MQARIRFAPLFRRFTYQMTLLASAGNMMGADVADPDPDVGRAR
jgi:hypothetical protein